MTCDGGEYMYKVAYEEAEKLLGKLGGFDTPRKKHAGLLNHRVNESLSDA